MMMMWLPMMNYWLKYLSQNKEAVLGDIIATIQKEQNEIIRISYLLYNYEEKYKSLEFCIVGSSDMLLNYISSGLPELDVNHVRQMRMDVFLPYLMGILRHTKNPYSTVIQ